MNSWRSTSGYEDDYEHDYGYELNYPNPYDSHRFPHTCNKDFETIPSKVKPMTKHQTHLDPWVNDS